MGTGRVELSHGLERGQIGEVVARLRQIQSAVVVAVAALKYQNCERDADIASLLQSSVTDRIEDQIEILETACAASAPRRGRRSTTPGHP